MIHIDPSSFLLLCLDQQCYVYGTSIYFPPKGVEWRYSLQEVQKYFVLRKFDNPFISLTAVNNVFELINSRIFALQCESIVTICKKDFVCFDSNTLYLI